ncbi:hypothetical protein V5T82_02465 [Magnetovibrio sp. PR-2]|uniref:hypothetical protein n=1 Tax=Magnetovibrio sp. PR-2 TaxID=3120356 RepID=UPI002FCE393B
MSLPVSIPVNPKINRAALCDGRARFREIVDAINADHGARLHDHRDTADFFYDLGEEPAGKANPVDIEHTMDGVNVIVVPGFMGECFASIVDCLTDGLSHIETFGARTSIAQVAGRGGSSHNGRILREHILNVTRDSDKRTILIPMSKGAPDTLEMLDQFPEIAERIDAIVSLVGCVGGSPLRYTVPTWLRVFLSSWPIPNCKPYGMAPAISMDPRVRAEFLERFAFPQSVKTYSVGVVTSEDQVCRGMLHPYQTLRKFDPVNGHLNDSQLMLADQILPNAKFLGALNSNHVAAAMPVERSHHWFARLVAGVALDKTAFPREVLVEAIVRQVLEDLPIS